MKQIVDSHNQQLAGYKTIVKSNDSRIESFTNRLNALELQLGEIASNTSPQPAGDVEKLRADFESFRRFITYLRQTGAIASTRKTAVLDLATRNYVCVDVEQGTLLVSCQDAEPYLDGVRLRLHIGNPMAVDFSEYAVKLRWGNRFKGAYDDTASYVKWHDSLEEKSFSQTGTLKFAAWNVCTIVLPDTNPEDLGFLEAEVDVNTVSLSRNYPDEKQ
ncbi:hypothetical protein [Rosistilla oblonga]